MYQMQIAPYCPVPPACSIHLSAPLKIPLMRYGICIRSHFEYDALSARASERFSLSFSLSSLLSLCASRLRTLPSSAPRDVNRYIALLPTFAGRFQKSITDRITRSGVLGGGGAERFSRKHLHAVLSRTKGHARSSSRSIDSLLHRA